MHLSDDPREQQQQQQQQQEHEVSHQPRCGACTITPPGFVSSELGERWPCRAHCHVASRAHRDHPHAVGARRGPEHAGGHAGP